MDNITFKLAKLPEDGSKLFLLDNQCFTRFYDNPAGNESEITDYLKDSQVYIYYYNEEPVAYFGIKETGSTDLEIKVLAVLPQFQGKGIGKSMIEKIFELYPQRMIYLYTHPSNSQAICFYLKHGFAITAWSENHYGDGQPRLKLNKP